MPVKRKDDDGPITGVQAFAGELRAQREPAGLTQAQLAKLMGYSESVVAKLETCRTIPSPQHAAQADEALRTPGTFRRLRQAMRDAGSGRWSSRGSPARRSGTGRTRRPRCCSLSWGRPSCGSACGTPRSCVTSSSIVLTWPGIRGSRFRCSPFGVAAHPGMLGPFLVASFDSDRDSAYLDNALDGQVTERRNQVARITLLYDSLRSVALSPGESMELIMKMADETWRT